MVLRKIIREHKAELARRQWEEFKKCGTYLEVCQRMSEAKGGRHPKEFVCPECNKTFYDYNDRKFCSIDCRARNKDFRKAQSLSKKKNPTNYWLGKKRPEMKEVKGFIEKGRSPWNKDRKCENLAKENHWNWQGGKSHERHSFYFKKLSKKLREEGICVFCYIEEDLVVHHIDLNKHNNELINLQVLCRSCHSKLHSVLSPIKFRQEVEI